MISLESFAVTNQSANILRFNSFQVYTSHIRLMSRPSTVAANLVWSHPVTSEDLLLAVQAFNKSSYHLLTHSSWLQRLSVIYTVVYLTNYPMSLYGSYGILPGNFVSHKTCKVCYLCFYCGFTISWTILWLLSSVGLNQACPNKFDTNLLYISVCSH